MPSIYDTIQLDGVVEQHRGSVSGYLGKLFFPAPAIVDQKYIAIDIVKNGAHGIAPHCKADMDGDTEAKEGYETLILEAPIRHLKKVLGRKDALTRAPGEKPTGQMSPEERLAAQAGQAAQKLLVRIDEGRECDIASCLVNEYFDAKDKDGNTIQRYTWDANPEASTVSTHWDAPGADPVGDLLAVRASIAGKSGAVADIAVMNSATFAMLMSSGAASKLLDQSQAVMANIDANRKPNDVGGFYAGNIVGIDIHVVDEAYSADENTLTKLIPDDKVIIGSRGQTKLFYGVADTMTRPQDGELIIEANDYVTNTKVVDNGFLVEISQAALPAIVNPKAFHVLTVS